MPSAPVPAPPPARGEMTLLAYDDDLARLPNRAALDAEIGAALGRARTGSGAVALAYVDLNEFKRVNDALGHELGDELLCQVADRLRGAVRPLDIVARRGGDGFLVLLRELPDASAREAAEVVGQRIADAIHAPFTLGAAELLVDAAIGLSLFPADADSPGDLRKHAEAAMYEAKGTGGGVYVYGEGTADPLERLALAARLRRGIERGELVLHHQPIMRLVDARVIGVESLVRWRDGARGLVPPSEFIPVAERTGVIDALGDWVLREVCRQAQAWAAEGLKPNVGYNVSPRQLRRPGAAQRIADTVRAHGIETDRFVLELTESAWSLEASRLLPVLQDLRGAGFALAIDDFGAGYSSLWRLRTLPVQVIKVDRAFLRDVPGDPGANEVYGAILRLADACGRDVVAEGVEESGHAQFLAASGCRIAQGYHFSRPVPAPEMTALLQLSITPERRTR